jgi:hypothetical protein
MERIFDENGRTISIVTWKDVRESVFAVNSELAKLIDALDPSDDYKFIEVEYKYGDIFIKNSEIQFPYKNDQLISILDNKVSKKIQKELFYTTMPLFLMMDKDNEVFIDTGSRVVPINLFHKGDISGVYETMDFMMGSKSEPIWNFAAGARSICILPKITNRQGLQRLFTTFNIPSTTQVRTLVDHWQILKMIAQSSSFGQVWKSKILCFGSKWIDNRYISNKWQQFRTRLFKEIWRQASFSIDKFKFNLCWEKFAETISLRRLQPKPYLIDQAKHIISIMLGDFPGFIPADMQQEVAPTKGFQDILVDIYTLKEYLPTILHSCLLTDSVLKPAYVYYSLSLPTVLEGSPVKKTSSTIASDIRQIKLLIDTLKNHVKEMPKLVGSSVIKNGKVQYFHRDKDKYNEIEESINIVKDDKSFLLDSKYFPNREFCHTSPFFSGCIRISDK